MKSPTFILELVVRDEELNPIKIINVTDFKLEEMGLCFIDVYMKECKEILFEELRKKYYGEIVG